MNPHENFIHHPLRETPSTQRKAKCLKFTQDQNIRSGPGIKMIYRMSD